MDYDASDGGYQSWLDSLEDGGYAAGVPPARTADPCRACAGKRKIPKYVPASITPLVLEDCDRCRGTGEEPAPALSDAPILF